METKPVITCLKTLLIVYSFVFWITGAILLAVGVWGKLMLGPYISLIADNSTNAPYVLIGTGTVIIVFGLFGCFATCRGSPWMLKLYAMFLSLVFLAELVAGISGFVFRHEIKGTFHRTYTDAVLNYNAEDEASRAVDNLQHKLRCCGVYNYTSWLASVYYPSNGIPASCCFNSSDCNPEDLRNTTIAPNKVFHQIISQLPILPLTCTNNISLYRLQTNLPPVFQGCYELVTSFMETNMAIIAGVTFGIAFSQLIGMLLACCLSRIITANQYEMV
ncbi:tetraspanin-7 isoform X1 [Paralichthys olivaceus]|uniref:tetraspanin-7 isoform X1 n=1 Tax=Paralichthys olivaceus TaxID=8255 RepID=UPI003751F698